MKTLKMSDVKSESGFVLIICMVLLLMLSLIGIASITTSTSDMQISGNELDQTGAFYAAESGIERAAASIVTSYETNGIPPNPLPSGNVAEGKYRYNYSTTSSGAAVQTTLTDGAYKGLYGLVRTFSINSTGYNVPRISSATLNMAIQDALIPLFQFAVFYQHDLEASPSQAMTLGGRVHSNGDMYLQSTNGLNIDSYLTAAGDIFHGPKSGSGLATASGNVFIKDKNAVYQNMKNGDGTWLDSQNSDWVNGSLSRWGGLTEDSNHGITELSMPVVSDGPQTDLIDRGAGNSDSFENKAGLKLVDGQAYFLQANGTWLNVTGTLSAQGVTSAGTFHDSREQQDVHSLDLDIQRLTTSGYYPTNGIIYGAVPTVSGSISAIRIKNGSTLPRATTVAAQNPLYTVGNFNTVAKKPAALLADAITVLSGNWNDANSWLTLPTRIATATQVNASYMTGDTRTGEDDNEYNGGFENLMRLLEKWDGVTFTWRGAAAELWNSRQATGEWSSGSYYSAPVRDWAFDTDLLNIANLPPGTPMVNIVQRTQWSQVTNAPGQSQ
jgi:hypothetical protein